MLLMPHGQLIVCVNCVSFEDDLKTCKGNLYITINTLFTLKQVIYYKNVLTLLLNTYLISTNI